MCDLFESGLIMASGRIMRLYAAQQGVVARVSGPVAPFRPTENNCLDAAGGAGMDVFCGVSRPCQDGIVVKERRPARRVGLTEVLESCTSI